MSAANLIGRRFAKLIVEARVANTAAGKTRWACRCDCGGQREVAAINLKSGAVRSCGCLNVGRPAATTLHRARKPIAMAGILQPLCASDLAALNVIAAAGARGLSREDLRATCATAGVKGSAKDFLDRVRLRGHAVSAIRVGYDQGAHIYSYVLAAPEPIPVAVPRSVTRIVTDVCGLGATPGARVSVAYVPCLDDGAARVTSGEG